MSPRSCRRLPSGRGWSQPGYLALTGVGCAPGPPTCSDPSHPLGLSKCPSENSPSLSTLAACPPQHSVRGSWSFPLSVPEGSASHEAPMWEAQVPSPDLHPRGMAQGWLCAAWGVPSRGVGHCPACPPSPRAPSRPGLRCWAACSSRSVPAAASVWKHRPRHCDGA